MHRPYRIYLATPYSSKEDSSLLAYRFDQANRVAANIRLNGILPPDIKSDLEYPTTVYSPISHTNPIAAYGLPHSYSFHKEDDRWNISIRDFVYVIKTFGIETSIGV